MKTLSMNDYRERGDLLGAYERFTTTSKQWKSRWWAVIEEIYNNFKTWAQKYVLDPATRTITEIKQTTRRKCRQVSASIYELSSGVSVECAEDMAKDIDRTEKAYLFKFYEDINPDPLFSKIGTSARTCFGRLKDEVRYYQNAGFDITRVKVERIINCGEMPAEAFESFCRSMFIKKYPNTWKKNDRFFGVDIQVSDFDKMWEMYSNF